MDWIAHRLPANLPLVLTFQFPTACPSSGYVVANKRHADIVTFRHTHTLNTFLRHHNTSSALLAERKLCSSKRLLTLLLTASARLYGWFLRSSRASVVKMCYLIMRIFRVRRFTEEPRASFGCSGSKGHGLQHCYDIFNRTILSFIDLSVFSDLFPSQFCN